jgi:hypothetical protein
MSVQVELLNVLVSQYNAIAEPHGRLNNNYFVYFKSLNDAKEFVFDMRRNSYNRPLDILYVDENSESLTETFCDRCKIFIDGDEISKNGHGHDDIPF